MNSGFRSLTFFFAVLVGLAVGVIKGSVLVGFSVGLWVYISLEVLILAVKRFGRRPVTAVVLSSLLGPGAGQIYNRDWLKGTALIFLSMILSGAVLVKLGRGIFNEMPSGNFLDNVLLAQQTWKTMMENVMKQNPRFYSVFSVLVSLTWIYGVVDAFLSSREKEAPHPPQDI